MFKYLVGSGVTALGAGLGVVDWRAFGRPWFGLALLAAAGAGAAMTALFPFPFADATLYIWGALLVAGAALALAGYAVVGFLWVVSGQIARARKARSR